MNVKRPNRYRFLYLVRHGEYEHAEGVAHGVLTERGVRQAEAVGRYFEGIDVTRYIASTMSRAGQTAEIMRDISHPGMKIARSSLLRERIFPGWKPMGSVPKPYRGSAAIIDRLAARHLRLARSETHEVLVCHGNVIRAFVTRVLGCPLESWTQMTIYNASITRVAVFNDRRKLLVSFNESDHVPGELRTP